MDDLTEIRRTLDVLVGLTKQHQESLAALSKQQADLTQAMCDIR